MTLTYQDQIKLAQSHLIHCRVQAQAAMRLLSTPPEGVTLEEIDFSRLAIAAIIGAIASELIEDINAEMDVRNVLELEMN